MTKKLSTEDLAFLETITPVSDAEASVLLGGRVTGKAYEVMTTALVGLTRSWGDRSVILTKQSMSKAVSLVDAAAMIREPGAHAQKIQRFESAFGRVIHASTEFSARLGEGKGFFTSNLHLVDGLAADLLALAERAEGFAVAAEAVADEMHSEYLGRKALMFARLLRTEARTVANATATGTEIKAERERIANDPQEQLTLIAKRIERNARSIAEDMAYCVAGLATGENVTFQENSIKRDHEDSAREFAKAQEWAAKVEDGEQHLANLASKMQGGEFFGRRVVEALRDAAEKVAFQASYEASYLASLRADQAEGTYDYSKQIAASEAALARFEASAQALTAALAEIEPPQAVEPVAVETVEQPAPEAEAVAEAEEDNGNELAEGFFAYLFGDTEEEEEIQEEAQPETSEAALVEEFADWPSALHGMFTPALAEALRTAQETPEAAQTEEEDHITDLAACVVGGGFGAVLTVATPEPKEPDAAPLPAALFGTVIAVQPQGGAVTCNPYAASEEAEASEPEAVPAQDGGDNETVAVDEWTARTLALLDALSEEIMPPEPVQAAPLRIDLPPPVVSPTPAKPSLIRRLLKIAA